MTKLKKKLSGAFAAFNAVPLASAVNSSINYGQPENVEKMSDFFLHYLNSETGGSWLAALAIISFGVPFMATLEYNAKAAFGSGAFSMLITMIMLSAFGLKGVGVYFVVAALAVTVAVVINNNSRGVAR
jgi:hypothetical protein